MKGREKILKEAYELLCEVHDPEKVTIREIAKRAEVGIGLINYHFKSKDLLLMEAVGKELAEVAKSWMTKGSRSEESPLEVLTEMLEELMERGAEQFYLIQVASKHELIEGDIHTPHFILPYVMQITGYDEEKSKMIAFSMISNMQSATIRNDRFKNYLGIDLQNQSDRKRYVKLLIDSHLLK